MRVDCCLRAVLSRTFVLTSIFKRLGALKYLVVGAIVPYGEGESFSCPTKATFTPFVNELWAADG